MADTDGPKTGTVAAVPVAVVGYACRLPGSAADPAAFWDLLRGGGSAITRIPEDRRELAVLADAAARHPGLRWGGFVEHVDRFDAEFFAISPREAAAIDPRQRLLLELGWEAIEHAGILPAALAGSRTGVFVGAGGEDYAGVQRAAAEQVGHFSFTGLDKGMLANRLSYFLRLRGPSLTVDTAQSSSLVAVHTACSALRAGEVSTAVAAGVNLNLAPESWLAMAELGALSPDGRCFTFDARANGFVRGEGGAAVLLKRLADAVADGDRIHAVIRGTAVNNDGGGRGFTVPDAPAQEEVLRLAYANAGVDPREVQYVELHGTGTKVGDPVEAAALGAVLGEGRTAADALHVGSVKTNVGHLESAAGIVGLIKVVAALEHRELPPSINFEHENPELGLASRGLSVRGEGGAWPRPELPLVAGVSSFGLGGTNCHVVLAEGPRSVEAKAEVRGEATPSPRVVPLLVSGRTPAAVRAQAGRLLERVEATSGDAALADVGYSLAATRTAFPHRSVLVGSTREDFVPRLSALRDGEIAVAPPAGGGLGFLFPGQGAQRVRAGAGLYGAYPVFASAFDEVCDELDRHLERSVRSVAFAPEGSRNAALLGDTLYTQTCLFALEVALYRLLESWGVRPDYLLGHSIGELAAAHVAGVFDLRDGCALVAARARLMQSLPTGGAMAAIQAGEDEVRASLDGYDAEQVGVAAVNGPQATVISGDASAVAEIADAWAKDRGRKTRRLRVSHAFHSAHMDPILAEFERIAAGLGPFRAPRIPLVSNVTGRIITTEGAGVLGPRYWAHQVRRAVRFGDGVASLYAARVTTFLELGPGGTLSAAAAGVANVSGAAGVFVPVLQANRDEAESATTAVGRLHTRGVPVDWERYFGGGRRVELPTYAFQRESHWIGRTQKTDQLAPPPETQRPDALRLIRSTAAAVLGHKDAAAVDPGRAFKELGFDSAMLLQLLDGVNASTGLELPAAAMFDYANSEALAQFVREQLDGTEAPSSAAAAVRVPRPVPTTASPAGEPIAIVGMACRYPGGVSSPEELWDLVAAGRDAIGGMPTDRGWDLEGLYDPDPDAVGKSYTRWGGFLDDAGDFDASFFGISPREALAMDPQQRLLLEVSWEAVERAGIDPSAMRGEQFGVFVGATANDYGANLHEPRAGFAGYQLTGSTPSVASGRIAYCLGLLGPAVTIDTACSSSLVALHLAAQSLRAGECTLALAGGVTVMPHPGMFVEFSRQRGLAVDGRCKAFSADADGTAWAEGVGVLLLQRLSDARREGRRVLAVVRGSAVNQDGASNGLTAPSGPAQQRVIRQALVAAGLSAGEVDVVEAHGTGTRLGDPVEAGALLAVYGSGRGVDRPLWLGSLKSNIGHAQAAAGVGGVIKMVMGMRVGVLPRTLHVGVPSGHVDWSSGGVRLLAEERVWSGEVRRAGVSSFGISGTNAHVIVESVADAPVSGGGDGSGVWVVSGRSVEGLRGQAARLARSVSGSGVGDVGVSLLGRSRFECRAVVTGSSRDELVSGLGSVAAGVEAGGVVVGRVVEGVDGGVVLVFPGQGWQWEGMGAELWESSGVFREVVRECARELGPLVDFDLVDVVRGGVGLPGSVSVQPVLFAVMVGLARVWQSWGVRVSGVVGHSQGEIAAAYVAGGLSLGDAVRVVALRARVLGVLCGRGSMLSVGLPRFVVEGLVGGWVGVSVAAVNGASSTVVSGSVEGLERVAVECEGRGVRVRWVPVDYASHSSQVEEVEGQVRAQLASIVPRSGGIPFYSTVTGGRVDTVGLDAGYWYRNLRQPVLFADTIGGLVEAGHRAFIEVSGHPVLVPALHEGEQGLVAVGSLRRNEGGIGRLVTSAAQAFTQGVEIDWHAIVPEGRVVPLPTYAFQHKRYWPSARADAFLGAPTDLAETGGAVFTSRLSLQSQSWLADHAVFGTVLLPGTAFVELAIRAGDTFDCSVLRELTLQAPLVLPAHGTVAVQVTVSAADERGERAISVHAHPDDDAVDHVWTLHATGVLVADAESEQFPPVPPSAWPAAGAEQVVSAGGVPQFYEGLAATGYAYGAALQGVRGIWRDGDATLVEAALPEDVPDGGGEGFGIHPALLDAVLHAIGDRASEDVPNLPFAWAGVRLHATGARAVRARITASTSSPDAVALQLWGPDGQLVMTVDSLESRPVRPEQLPRTAAATAATTGSALYRLHWPELATSATSAQEWAVVGEDFADALAAAGIRAQSWSTVGELADAVATGKAGPPPVTVLPVRSGNVVDLVQRVLHEVRDWLERDCWGTENGIRLLVLTRGAIAADPGDDVADVAAAGAWGLVRSAQQEYADAAGKSRILLVDSDAHSLHLLPAAVAAANAGAETQLVLRRHAVRAARLAELEPALALLPADEQSWTFEAARPGRERTLDAVALVARQPSVGGGDGSLPPGHVRIEVRAVGINFRDVVVSLGLVPDLEGVGIEVAGVVVEAGAGVVGVRVGDRVMGMAPDGAGSTVVTDARLVARIPGADVGESAWSWETAAAVPVVFLTAWYALVELARLHRGESVLVHAAAGGVGLAAVQIARGLGARVLGTASVGKQDVVREAGVDPGDVFSSRTLEFEAGVLTATDGRGVDVVLNALAGPFTDASLRLSAAGGGGRFIEMGKTDIRDPGQVAARHPGVAYQAFDLIAVDPDRIRTMMSELVARFERGELTPLPTTPWDVRRAPEALRYVSQARHVGKVVLHVPRRLDPDGTVLVTGGTGTLGAITARHLVERHGARHLLLISRRGPQAAGAADLVAELAAAGARTVDVVACDVSDRVALAAALGQVDSGRPITAVVHAAGLLDDALIATMNAEQVRRVLEAKAVAAWHLHELTRGHDLAAFVLFSSAVATFGNVGQGAYAAANAVLDALAQHRRQRGLPALSLGWGLWEQSTGMTSGMTDADRVQLARAGMPRPLPTDRALELLDEALAAPVPHALPLPSPGAVFSAEGAVRASAAGPAALLRDLVRAVAPPRQRPNAANAAGARVTEAGSTPGIGLREQLAALTPGECRAHVLAVVMAQAAAVLGHAAVAGLDARQPFKDLGFDSLTGVELRNRLGSITGISLPPTIVFRYPSPEQLADHLLEELGTPAEGGHDPDPLREFELWEASLADAGDALDRDGVRSELTRRLRRALLRLDTVGSTAEDGESDADAELFSAIDRELGLT